MAENSGIEWTTHTFNAWRGCQKVSAACDNCYAEELVTRRLGGQWGPKGERVLSKTTWSQPPKWNREAEGASDRPRVFCFSLADVLDNHSTIQTEWRERFYAMVESLKNLDFLLLTKRPQNAPKLLPTKWMNEGLPSNVWMGATVEDQTEYDRRISHLKAIPARVRFLSMEPLQGGVDMGDMSGLHWIIAGGESGSNYRPADPNWFRSIRDQCAKSQTPFLFKQWEGKSQSAIKAKGRELDGVVHDGYPTPTEGEPTE